jgi:enamine deaminase RidA (YjgF/YER057c/UK114 family)
VTYRPENTPRAQGDYVAATRHGDLIFTAGMTPRRDGLLLHEGPVQPGVPIDTYRDAARLCCSNALCAVRSKLESGECISSVLSLTIYIAAEPGFTQHSALADYASAFLRDQLGNAGIGARAAVGVATLPANASVEVQIVAAAGIKPIEAVADAFNAVRE